MIMHSKSFVIYRKLLFYSGAFVKVFLQKYFIFREIHKRDSHKCSRIPIVITFDHTTKVGKNFQNSKEKLNS